jgi:hypothetical protein
MKTRTLVIFGAILLASISRTIPHPPNFAPMTAMALFAGAVLADKRWAIALPLVSLFVSDLCIEAMHKMGLMSSWGIYSGMWVIYVTMVVVTFMGFILRGRKNVGAVAGMTVAGSIVFFVVTNFAVWAGGGLYSQDLGGLVACYTAAIPFFNTEAPPLGFLGNTLFGDAVYSTALFGGLALAGKWLPNLREAPSPGQAG